jgi:predicted metal-dependent phosphoesterase TrpH
VSIDLHVHSTASDGTLTPAALVREAAGLGLRAIALSDHDSVAGVDEALEAGAASGVVVVPALELSASADERDMHILGYRIAHHDERLAARLAEFRAMRRERALRMIGALREAGYGLTPDDVFKLAGEGSLGRAHIARALEETGATSSMGEAFRELIGAGRPFFVPKPHVSPEEVIGVILRARGIPVLAHPGISRVDDLLERLIAAGLRGIEVWHSEHSAEDVHRYGEIARRRGLLVTGGSDYHGPGGSGGTKRLGGVDVPDAVLDALLAADVVD